MDKIKEVKKKIDIKYYKNFFNEVSVKTKTKKLKLNELVKLPKINVKKIFHIFKKILTLENKFRRKL